MTITKANLDNVIKYIKGEGELCRNSDCDCPGMHNICRRTEYIVTTLKDGVAEWAFTRKCNGVSCHSQTCNYAHSNDPIVRVMTFARCKFREHCSYPKTCLYYHQEYRRHFRYTHYSCSAGVHCARSSCIFDHNEPAENRDIANRFYDITIKGVYCYIMYVSDAPAPSVLTEQAPDKKSQAIKLIDEAIQPAKQVAKKIEPDVLNRFTDWICKDDIMGDILYEATYAYDKRSLSTTPEQHKIYTDVLSVKMKELGCEFRNVGRQLGKHKKRKLQ